jgi:hypothetical protein
MNIRSIIRAVTFTPGPNGHWGLPMLFEGQPGKAKTATVNSVGAEMGLHVETIIAQIREPSDFAGIPIPNQTYDALIRLPDAWVARVIKHERAVVFLDEFNWAPPAVLSAMLRVVNERAVGDIMLPAGVRFLAAQNAVGEGGGADLTPAMANRFGHMRWDGFDAEEWCNWLLGGDEAPARGDAAKEEQRVMAAWPNAYAKARGLAAGFIKRKPGLLHKMPDVNDPKASKAWCSPRSWELATRALAGAEVHALPAVDADELVTAFIGNGAASEWAGWRRMTDLPDPADVLDGKVKFEHNPQRLDRTEAVLSSCAALCTPQSAHMREKRAGALWKIMGEVSKDATDVCVQAFRALVNANLSLHPETKAYAAPVLARVQPMLVSSGYKARK